MILCSRSWIMIKLAFIFDGYKVLNHENLPTIIGFQVHRFIQNIYLILKCMAHFVVYILNISIDRILDNWSVANKEYNINNSYIFNFIHNHK